MPKHLHLALKDMMLSLQLSKCDQSVTKMKSLKCDIVTKMKSLHHRLESPLVCGLQVQVAISALLDKVPGEKSPGNRGEMNFPGVHEKNAGEN